MAGAVGPGPSVGRDLAGRRGGRGASGALLVAAALLVASLAVAGCGAAEPSTAAMATEPVLRPLPDEVVLGTTTRAPRKDRIGKKGRDGVVERVVAVRLGPSEVADLLQRRDGDRYGFRRTDLGQGSAVTVELHGRAPDGADVLVVVSSRPPVPLASAADQLEAQPTDHPTGVVVTLTSRQ